MNSSCPLKGNKTTNASHLTPTQRNVTQPPHQAHKIKLVKLDLNGVEVIALDPHELEPRPDRRILELICNLTIIIMDPLCADPLQKGIHERVFQMRAC